MKSEVAVGSSSAEVISTGSCRRLAIGPTIMAAASDTSPPFTKIAANCRAAVAPCGRRRRASLQQQQPWRNGQNPQCGSPSARGRGPPCPRGPSRQQHRCRPARRPGVYAVVLDEVGHASRVQAVRRRQHHWRIQETCEAGHRNGVDQRVSPKQQRLSETDTEAALGCRRTSSQG